MNKRIAEKLEGYDPQRHTIAIYTSTHHLAQWVATRCEFTRHQWFYVKDIHDIYAKRDLYLLFYGDFMERDDFDEIWMYWENFMPSNCHYYLLEQDVE